MDALPPVIDSYTENEGKFMFRNSPNLEYVNFGENRMKDYKALIN